MEQPIPQRILSELERQVVAQFPSQGVFLTGIESSDPWIDGTRRNQLKEAHDFYAHYTPRLNNIASLGIQWLRFGPAYSESHRGIDSFDFSFSDKVIRECQRLGIELIADLLHFGLPRWLHEGREDTPFFQNPAFPELFASWAETFTKRYPHIRYFTVVNEPYITAYFSAKIGIWNEQLRSEWHDDRYFVTAVKHIAKAAILGKRAIEKVWREENRADYPIFVQNESFEVSLSKHESRKAEVERFNLRKFAALDLIFGTHQSSMRDYLTQQGMSEEEYSWFMTQGNKERIILGVDHYPMCVHLYEENAITNCDPLYPNQLREVMLEYWDRYHLPLLHTETNAWPDHAVKSCQETFAIISKLREEGYPVLGMGWYGDEYQVGWHHALTGPHAFEETPVGLFYKGKPQPVSECFANHIQKGFPPIRDS